MLENSIVIEDKNLVSICRDPDDNKFLNCALLGGADYLISGDNDLLVLKIIGSSKIVTPAEFLRKYQKS